ncbi:hypothetical protein FBUS_07937 [Fasciolopsis buskii]|uniref:Uncharacterized protein n=1 Tax=Fasciolopsis buskii TaxID=27845 RepID=A0A8E0RS78_9TREM|nr:hypothetical protein FBUS_07937 [Fasciolopsis buski]
MNASNNVAERKLLRRKIEEQNEEIIRSQQELQYITEQTRGLQLSSEEAVRQLEKKLQKSSKFLFLLSNRENTALREEQQRVLATMRSELQSYEEQSREANASKKQLHEKLQEYASHSDVTRHFNDNLKSQSQSKLFK